MLKEVTKELEDRGFPRFKAKKQEIIEIDGSDLELGRYSRDALQEIMGQIVALLKKGKTTGTFRLARVLSARDLTDNEKAFEAYEDELSEMLFVVPASHVDEFEEYGPNLRIVLEAE
jgi:hypothetical protein